MALWPIAFKYLVWLVVPLEPSQAVVEKALAVVEIGLATLAIGNPVHALWAQQQVQVVTPGKQCLFQPGRQSSNKAWLQSMLLSR